jgi:hypothetical protein
MYVRMCACMCACMCAWMTLCTGMQGACYSGKHVQPHKANFDVLLRHGHASAAFAHTSMIRIFGRSSLAPTASHMSVCTHNTTTRISCPETSSRTDTSATLLTPAVSTGPSVSTGSSVSTGPSILVCAGEMVTSLDSKLASSQPLQGSSCDVCSTIADSLDDRQIHYNSPFSAGLLFVHRIDLHSTSHNCH